MEATDSNSQLGYGKPPWIFKGCALYQLHLVKAKTARAFIPKEFKLVEAFGYTLGGFFLANYDDSPAGTFDELVVIAGTVWNPPTYCSWAARVLVSSDKACVHGREEVGLPSEVASFSKRAAALPMRKKSQFHDFLHKSGTFDSSSPENGTDIHIKEMSNNIAMDICGINLNASVSQNNSKKWLCPAIKISLPSFSGRTEYNPHLLKYSCQMTCRVRMVPSVKVRGPSQSDVQGEVSSENGGFEIDPSSNNKRKLIISVMLSKPILALEFNCLKMKVEAPTIVQQ